MNCKTVLLKDLVLGEKGSYGIGAPAVDYDPKKYTYLRITDINDDGSINTNGLKSVDAEDAYKYILQENDIVFARTGASTGKTYFYQPQDGTLVYAGFLIKFSIDPQKVNPRLLKYITHSQEYYNWVHSFDTGGTRGNINAVTFANMPITLPDRATQDKIVAILSSIDDKIELNRRINANLEQQAQALYKSWFVDFEPWGGKMPEDWRVGTISNIVDLLNGFAFKSSDFVEKGLYKLITIKGVQDGNMSLDGADCLDIIPPKMPQWCKLKKEDILLSLTGNVGRCCLVDTENCLLNQRVAKLHPKEEYNRLFVYALFRQEDMKARMISIARGTAQMNLSPIETGKLPLIIPSNEVLKDFGNRFNNIIHTLTNNIVESSYLAQLRDTLLPKLMSGGIKV